MKLVRWQGLIAFVVVLIVVMGVWFLVIDSIIEAVIEKTGTHVVGAKVELEAADLSISPFGISLTGLQVTNPDSPMTNVVQVDRMALSVEGAKLFRRKVIVKEMTMAGVRLNTPRKTSGAISRRPSAAPKSVEREKFTLPALAIPNVNEILQKEKLQSLELVNSLQADLQAEKDQWHRRLAELPDKAKFAQYRERIEKIQSAKKGGLEGVLGGAKDAMAVQKEIRRDLDRIKTARKELGENLASFQKRTNKAAKAPLADVNRLKEKYTLSPEGLTNISRLVFGEKIAKWADTALDWYERLKPVLERAKEGKKGGGEVVKPVRGKGADVLFKEHEPLPDLLIRTSSVSMEIPAGSIKGQIRNITPDQDVLGIPLTYNFSGENLKGLQAVKLNGVLNHVNPSSPKDTATLDVSGYQVADLSLSDSLQLPIELKKASTDFKAEAVLSGQAIKANLLAGLKSVRISTGVKKDAGPLAKAMASSLSDVEQFNVKVDISGTLKDYDMQLSSDLDRVLKNAVGKQVKTQAARLEKELKDRIFEKVKGPLSDLKADLGGLDSIGNELTRRLNLGGDLLKGTEKEGSGGLKLPDGFPKF